MHCLLSSQWHFTKQIGRKNFKVNKFKVACMGCFFSLKTLPSAASELFLWRSKMLDGLVRAASKCLGCGDREGIFYLRGRFGALWSQFHRSPPHLHSRLLFSCLNAGGHPEIVQVRSAVPQWTAFYCVFFECPKSEVISQHLEICVYYPTRAR